LLRAGHSICYKARSTPTPAYLQSLLVPHVPSRPLRSSHAPRLAVPRTRTVFASRAFSVAASTVWNSLPDNVGQLGTPWQLLKKATKNSPFSLRHVKRSCHGAPLHFLLWRQTSFVIVLYCIVLLAVCHVAVNRPSFQSSVFSEGPDNAPMHFIAHFANDGARITTLASDGIPQCAHTKSDTNPWWAVDLGAPLSVQEIVFTNRQNSREHQCCTLDDDDTVKYFVPVPTTSLL